MKIIFIHGMNQQNYTAHRLKEHWLKVFKLGLKQMPCRVNIRDLHIHMPFYGDLMTKYQLSNQLDLNTLLPKSFFNNYFPINVHPSNPPTRVIYAELSGDFPLGDSRQPIYKSLRPF
ncbi:hypothetical protein RFI06_17580, partial [Acinetobacter pittii]|nr:hypothetical protein [Acinetobacter pittii]MDQ8872673.1 hypothetical protein [Acinetobacter pittii]